VQIYSEQDDVEKKILYRVLWNKILIYEYCCQVIVKTYR